MSGSRVHTRLFPYIVWSVAIQICRTRPPSSTLWAETRKPSQSVAYGAYGAEESDGECVSALELRANELWAQRCNIDKVPFVPGQVLNASDRPYIVRLPPGHNAYIQARLAREELLMSMGNATCTPSRAGNVRRDIIEMTIREYVEDWMSRGLSENAEENRYVFGEFGDQWAPLRDAYLLPPCRSCTGPNVAITIGLGGLHSGAPWHSHGASYIEMLHGAKHIALLPPDHRAIPEIDVMIKNLSQYHWHRQERPAMEVAGQLEAMVECVIVPGEVLYAPAQWHHGVVNADAYTAFVSSFVAREDSI